MAASEKHPEAFRTIGELSEELGIAQHILRYWESRFPQLRPLQRAGNRRYYRPADVALVRRIHHLLSNEGYTVRGVQKLLRESPAAGQERAPAAPPAPVEIAPAAAIDTPAIGEPPAAAPSVDVERLIELRDRLQRALHD